MLDTFTLGLDTATNHLSLAVWSSGHGLVAKSEKEVGRDHAARLLVELESLLERAEVRKTELQAIGVGTGPGSYTGLRVGLATARGLSRGLAIPLVGTSTLEAISAAHLSEAQPEALIALDARRGNVYAGRYRLEAGEIYLQELIKKLARSELRAAYPELPYIEAGVPDAAYLAAAAQKRAPGEVKLLYL